MDLHEILAIPLAIVVLAGFALAVKPGSTFPAAIGATGTAFTGSIRAATLQGPAK